MAWLFPHQKGTPALHWHPGHVTLAMLMHASTTHTLLLLLEACHTPVLEGGGDPQITVLQGVKVHHCVRLSSNLEAAVR
jgi:hypothetical protein